MLRFTPQNKKHLSISLFVLLIAGLFFFVFQNLYFRTQISLKERKVKSLTHDKQVLEQKKSRLEAKVNGLQNDLSKSEEERTAVIKEYNTVVTQLTSTEKQLEQTEREKDELKKKVKELTKFIKVLEGDIKGRDDIIIKLSKVVDEVEVNKNDYITSIRNSFSPKLAVLLGSISTDISNEIFIEYVRKFIPKLPEAIILDIYSSRDYSNLRNICRKFGGLSTEYMYLFCQSECLNPATVKYKTVRSRLRRLVNSKDFYNYATEIFGIPSGEVKRIIEVFKSSILY
ncbi:hypothetical protein ACFL5S_01120 [Fibrobacterota bacterium]